MPPTNALRAGRDALAQGAWEEARAAFETAAAEEETPEALEGLGAAAWWMLDLNTAIRARERAFNLYRERGDLSSAARMALWVTSDHNDRGDMAVANGWMQRASRLLESAPPTPEHAFLDIMRGHITLMSEADPTAAIDHAKTARRAAKTSGSVDFEMLALALEGLARVSRGEVTDGMALLDEATAAATGGEMSDLNAIGWACCYLIHACYRVRDYDRAAQWCNRVQTFCRRWRFDSMFTTCRTHYASILMWRGELEAAEHELAALEREARDTLPPLVRSAIVRLGELRRRQGRLDEASALFAQAPDHKLAVLGRAALALDRAQPEAAVELLNTLVRRLPHDNRTDRLPALELLVRARLAIDDLDAAAATVAELRDIADTLATEPVRASTLAAEGLLSAARGDLEAARRCFEDAAYLFERNNARYEADRAREQLERLDAARQPVAGPSPLTPRELQVLQLVAKGLTDKEVAAKLGLSEHTVHRHVSNILSKTRQPSRTAAVAHAVKSGFL